METSIKNWLSPKEVFTETGISKSTLAKWRMENKYLPYSKIGKFIKYKREDIETLLSTNIINTVDEVS